MPWWRESLTQVVRSLLVAGFFGRVFTRVILSVATSYSRKPLKNDTWKYSLDSSGEKTAGRTASEKSLRPMASRRWRMSITLTCLKVAASTTVIFRSPFVQSSQGSSSAVVTSPMAMFQMYLPSWVKMFSCGLSPVANEPSCLPVVMSSTCTAFAVEAETATRVPSGDTAMWSER